MSQHVFVWKTGVGLGYIAGFKVAYYGGSWRECIRAFKKSRVSR